MKSWILPGLFSLVVLAGCGAQRSDKELLAELLKLKAAPDLKAENIKTPDELQQLWKKRGTTAQTVLKEFESNHANSPLLNEARVETLKILRQDPSAGEAASAVAKTLLAAAPKGSDLAAQADLYLALREFQSKFSGLRNAEELRDVWYRHAESLRSRFEGLLTTYPKDRHIADAAEEVLQMADLAGDPEARRLIQDLVSQNQPDHPIAVLAHREKMSLGKEFVFEFMPVGSAKKMSLKDLRGKVVVLDFWATWCPPCVAEIPRLKELYEKYQAKGLEIIGVSQDHAEADLTKFVKAKDVRWPQVFGEEAQTLAHEWGVAGLPTVYLVDRQGRLHSLNARGKLERLVPELLGVK